MPRQYFYGMSRDLNVCAVSVIYVSCLFYTCEVFRYLLIGKIAIMANVDYVVESSHIAKMRRLTRAILVLK